MGCDLAGNVLQAVKAKKKRSFSQMFGEIGEEGLDLLRRMLAFNPRKRPTIEEALNHPYLKRFHNSQDELVAEKVIKLPIDDNIKLSLKMYREAIYKDITYKIREARKKPVGNVSLPKLRDGS